MIAALPMYDRPETAGALDRLWAGTRARLRVAGLAAPEALSCGGDLWAQWRSPDLVLGQTCGLPYRAHLHPYVTLIATPDHALPGCPPGHYRSVLICAADDVRETAAFSGAPMAFNEALSQSGWAAPQAHFAARGLAIRPALETGSHQASARAVAEGRAAFAAVDAVCWEMLRRWEPFTARLRVFDRTEPAPALPFIAARGADGDAIRRALGAAFAALAPRDRGTLAMRGLVALPASTYLALPLPPAP